MIRRVSISFLWVTVACASTPTSSARQDVPIAQAKDTLLAETAVAVAYSGFRTGQHPDRGDGANNPTDEQMLEDLNILVGAGFTLIRLYDSGDNSAAVLRLIETNALPIRVMLGAWIDAELSNHEGCEWLTEPIPEDQLMKNAARNRAEVERTIALALAHPKTIVAVNVGNEALVSWTDHLVKVDALMAYAAQVKAKIQQPVTTADNYVVWIENGPELMRTLDFAAVHTYPAWEEKTIDEAMAYSIANIQAIRNVLPNARLTIGEAGWPSIASEFGPRANEANQKRYYDELTSWARAMNITTFVFEAFDEDWKGNPNDPLGAEKHWGLFGIDRKPKLVMLQRDEH